MDHRIHRAIRYVDERINQTVSIADVAGHLGMSPFHFHHLFRKELGEPFYGYVKRVRLSGAAARLEWTSDTIFDIALAFGYSSNAAFSHAFVKHYGCSPSRYRAGACRPHARTKALSPGKPLAEHIDRLSEQP